MNALHAARVPADVTPRSPTGTLPDGAFVLDDGEPWLVLADELLHWTPGGYDRRRRRPTATAVLEPVTPPSLIELLRTGWTGAVPLLHPSAGRE